jgi:hypothetical protein
MEVQVEIMVQTITGQYGTLNPGDTLRTDFAFAEHLVYDCMAARYMPAPVSAVAEVMLESQHAEAIIDVQTSAQADPYAHLGTLIAAVPGVATEPGSALIGAEAGVVDAVQTSAQGNEPVEAAAAELPAESPVRQRKARPAVTKNEES